MFARAKRARDAEEVLDIPLAVYVALEKKPPAGEANGNARGGQERALVAFAKFGFLVLD